MLRQEDKELKIILDYMASFRPAWTIEDPVSKYMKKKKPKQHKAAATDGITFNSFHYFPLDS